MTRGMAHHLRPKRSRNNWQPGALKRGRVHHGVLSRVVLAVVRGHVLRQEETEQLYVLAESGSTLSVRPVRQADHLSTRINGETGADPELDAAARDLVDGYGLMSEHTGMAKRDLRDVRRQPDGRSLCSESRHKRPALHPVCWWVGPIAEMIGHGRNVEAEFLDLEHLCPVLRPGRPGSVSTWNRNSWSMPAKLTR